MRYGYLNAESLSNKGSFGWSSDGTESSSVNDTTTSEAEAVNEARIANSKLALKNLEAQIEAQKFSDFIEKIQTKLQQSELSIASNEVIYKAPSIFNAGTKKMGKIAEIHEQTQLPKTIKAFLEAAVKEYLKTSLKPIERKQDTEYLVANLSADGTAVQPYSPFFTFFENMEFSANQFDRYISKLTGSDLKSDDLWGFVKKSIGKEPVKQEIIEGEIAVFEKNQEAFFEVINRFRDEKSVQDMVNDGKPKDHWNWQGAIEEVIAGFSRSDDEKAKAIKFFNKVKGNVELGNQNEGQAFITFDNSSWKLSELHEPNTLSTIKNAIRVAADNYHVTLLEALNARKAELQVEIKQLEEQQAELVVKNFVEDIFKPYEQQIGKDDDMTSRGSNNSMKSDTSVASYDPETASVSSEVSNASGGSELSTSTNNSDLFSSSSTSSSEADKNPTPPTGEDTQEEVRLQENPKRQFDQLIQEMFKAKNSSKSSETRISVAEETLNALEAFAKENGLRLYDINNLSRQKPDFYAFLKKNISEQNGELMLNAKAIEQLSIQYKADIISTDASRRKFIVDIAQASRWENHINEQTLKAFEDFYNNIKDTKAYKNPEKRYAQLEKVKKKVKSLIDGGVVKTKFEKKKGTYTTELLLDGVTAQKLTDIFHGRKTLREMLFGDGEPERADNGLIIASKLPKEMRDILDKIGDTRKNDKHPFSNRYKETEVKELGGQEFYLDKKTETALSAMYTYSNGKLFDVKDLDSSVIAKRFKLRFAGGCPQIELRHNQPQLAKNFHPDFIGAALCVELTKEPSSSLFQAASVLQFEGYSRSPL